MRSSLLRLSVLNANRAAAFELAPGDHTGASQDAFCSQISYLGGSTRLNTPWHFNVRNATLQALVLNLQLCSESQLIVDQTQQLTRAVQVRTAGRVEGGRY